MDHEVNLNYLGTVLTEKDAVVLMQILKRQMLVSEYEATKNTEFPGSHPVTLLKKHVDVLCNVDYFVCEKSDGVRIFLWIYKHQNTSKCFLVDRKSNFYYYDLDCTGIGNCCFDGEIFLETCNGKKQYVFAIFDTLIYNDENVMKQTLLQRLQHASKFVSLVKHSMKMTITVKNMYKCYGFCEVYKNIPKLNHKNDGMIFTPIEFPYMPGRCNTWLKWKPADLNTIDFKLDKHSTINYAYNLSCMKGRNNYVIFDFYFDSEMQIVDRYDNLIGEFYYVDDLDIFDPIDFSVCKGGWVLHKIRTDKKTPNSLKVAINILQSIKENISYMDLEKHFFEIRDNWKSREKEKQMSKKRKM